MWQSESSHEWQKVAPVKFLLTLSEVKGMACVLLFVNSLKESGFPKEAVKEMEGYALVKQCG